MPRVDIYGARKVAPAPLPGARLTSVPSPQSFGAGFGEKLASLAGNAAIDMADEARQKADEIAVLAARNELATWETKRVYDPENGAMTVKGKDSFGLPEQVHGEFEKEYDRIIGGLHTDRQRIAFARFGGQRREAVNGLLMRHVYSEMQQYDAAETKSFIENSVNAGIANATDPRAINEQLTSAVDEVRRYGARQHLGPEQIAEHVSGVQTAMHTGVINRLLSLDQDQAAKVYFDETKGQIKGEGLAKIEHALEEGNSRGAAQRTTDQIMATAKSETEALDQAKAIENPKQRDLVSQRIEHEFALRAHAKQLDNEATMLRLGNLIDQNPAKGVWNIAPGDWQSLTVGQKTQLELYAKRNAPGEAGVKTDLPTFYRLWTLGTNPATRDRFAETDLTGYLGVIGKTEFKQLAELQGAIRNKDDKKEHELTASDHEITQIENQALSSIGLDPTPPELGSKNYDKFSLDRVVAFKRMVREAVAAKEKNKGNKKLTSEEIQGIVDTLIAPGAPRVQRKGRIFWDTTVPGYAFETSQAQVKTVTEVPQGARQDISNALLRAGRPVTDAAILDLFNRRLREVRGDVGR